MKLLSKLNPINSLFGRIFLWFWLATLLMVLSAIWLAKQGNSNYTLKPLDEKSQKRLDNMAKRIELIASRKPQTNLSMLLGRAGQRDKLALMLIHLRSNEFTFGFPRRLSPDKAPFVNLLNQNQGFSVNTSSGVFHGPSMLNIDGQQYALFAGRPLPQGMIRQFHRQHPWLLIGVALLISGGLCALLAWSLVRPLRELSRSAQQMSQGDLSARVKVANKRSDELGQLAKDFNHMSERVELLLGSQKRLVADVSHELRSPLARLQLAIGIAQQDPSAASHQNLQNQLRRIEKESHQIDAMIGQVLKLSRLEAQMPQETIEIMTLEELLGEVISDGQFEAENANKEFICCAIPDSVTIQCYPELLTSAVRNVLSNAIKYAATKVEVSIEIQQSTLHFQVKDDGLGVPDAELANIFVPFYRLSASRNRNTGGVGLGLAISQQALQMHEGTISAHNYDDVGLCVKVSVPLNQKQKVKS